MKSTYKKLGPYIRQVNIRNTEDKKKNLLGVSTQKVFIESIANTVGTNFKRYKVVKRNQFTYVPDTSRRGDRIGIALLEDYKEGLVSNVYTVFEVIDPNQLIPQYLMMWFRRPEFDRYARFKSHGNVREVFDWDEMCDVELPIPPIEKQRAIVREYNTIVNRIKLNRQMNATLEAMAQALFKSWFVDFGPVLDNALAAGNPIPPALRERAELRRALGDNRRPLPADIQQLFPSRFVFTEELGWIPEGWEVSTVGVEFNVTMGQSPPGDTYNEEGEGTPFFQGRTDFGFRYPSNRVYCTAPKRFASKGDTLVSVRAPVGDVNMAAEDCCIGRGVSASRHKSGSRSFTYYSMLQLREHFKIYEAEGTVFGSINQKDFKALPQLSLPSALVQKFEEYVGKIDRKIELNTETTRGLSNLRDTLLPKLISGELRIPEAEKLIEETL